jgi:BolA protein
MAKLTALERAELIRSRLTATFHPETLHIIDDSHLHAGHEGAKGGASHFTVQIKSRQFENQSRIAQHRLIYQELNELIPNEIHALKIQILK